MRSPESPPQSPSSRKTPAETPGRPWVSAGVFLLDGDCGGDSGDLIYIRLLDALQELPGIGRKRLDVAALAFRIDGVKRQAGFARAAHAGDHGDGVVRDVKVHVFQVVDARPAHADGFLLLDCCGSLIRDQGRAPTVGLSSPPKTLNYKSL